MNHQPAIHHHNELGGGSPAPDPRGCVVVVVVHLPFAIVTKPFTRRRSPTLLDLAVPRLAAARSGGLEADPPLSSERDRGLPRKGTTVLLAFAAPAPTVVSHSKREEGATASVPVRRGRGRWESPPPAPRRRREEGGGRRETPSRCLRVGRVEKRRRWRHGRQRSLGARRWSCGRLGEMAAAGSWGDGGQGEESILGFLMSQGLDGPHVSTYFPVR